jgi:hypothetical protein
MLLMPDSQLNGAEQPLQHSFMKSSVFSGLMMAAAVTAAYLPIRSLPDRRPMPAAMVQLNVRPVSLPAARLPLRLAGAWELAANDHRFTGLSALSIDRGRFLAVSDRGATVRFDMPSSVRPMAWIADLRIGPGTWGKKWARDAESLTRDPGGRGWWVGYEQRHSLWLYDEGFDRGLTSIDLRQDDWSNNHGAEGLLANDDQLLVVAENGREAIRASQATMETIALDAGADVADAALAPDGSAWLLLRSRGPRGITQSLAPLVRMKGGYRAGQAWPVPKGLFDNYEGLTIAPRPGGGWRFWLVSDDGHRVMARTLLVAIDLVTLPRHDKSPAQGAGLSKKPTVETP